MKIFNLKSGCAFFVLQNVFAASYNFEKEIRDQKSKVEPIVEMYLYSLLEDSIDVEILCKNFPKLRILRITNTKLKSIPEGLEKLSELKIFIFDHNFELVDPIKIAAIPSLRFLSISQCNLTSLPFEISDFKSLKTLILSDNKLTSLPAEIKDFESLETLILSDNKLTALPVEIGKLQSIKYLFLANNLLTKVPKSIRYLFGTIISLVLSGNQIPATTDLNHYGFRELRQTFFDSVLIDGIEIDTFKKVALHTVKNRIGFEIPHWNYEILKTFKDRRPLKHERSYEELLKIWDDQLKPVTLLETPLFNPIVETENEISVDETVKLFEDYIEHVYIGEKDYKKNKIGKKDKDLAKDYLESIILLMHDKLNFETSEIENCRTFQTILFVIAQGISVCSTGQIEELKNAYATLMEMDRNSSELEHFVKTFIASQKNVIFKLVVTPVFNIQSTHVSNYWQFRFKDELGLDSNLVNGGCHIDEDPFKNEMGNVLEAFNNEFRPYKIIKLLTDEINKINEVCNSALQIIEYLDEDDSFKNKLRAYEDPNQTDDSASKITEEFTKYYLVKNKILIDHVEDFRAGMEPKSFDFIDFIYDLSLSGISKCFNGICLAKRKTQKTIKMIFKWFLVAFSPKKVVQKIKNKLFF